MEESRGDGIVAIKRRGTVVFFVLLNSDKEEIATALLVIIDAFSNTVRLVAGHHTKAGQDFGQAVVTMDLQRDAGDFC